MESHEVDALHLSAGMDIIAVRCKEVAAGEQVIRPEQVLTGYYRSHDELSLCLLEFKQYDIRNTVGETVMALSEVISIGMLGQYAGAFSPGLADIGKVLWPV